MTVSITRAWTSRPSRPGARAARSVAGWALAALLALAVLLLAASPARATEIAALSAERGSEGVVLSAQIRLDIPGQLDDALQKGIPLFFVAEATVLRDRWYWTDKEVARATRYLRLAYHPLTRRWRLLVSSAPITNAGGVLGQSFESREEALAAVQRIAGWKIAEGPEIDGAPRYTVTLRFRLDLTQLPRPVQIGGFGQEEGSLEASRTLRLNPEPAR